MNELLGCEVFKRNFVLYYILCFLVFVGVYNFFFFERCIVFFIVFDFMNLLISVFKEYNCFK